MGTYETKFVIPNLNKEVKRIPVSSVVLSSHRVDLKEAIYNALKSKDQAEVTNPLVQEGQKLIPSVTRVFSARARSYRAEGRVLAGSRYDCAVGAPCWLTSL